MTLKHHYTTLLFAFFLTLSGCDLSETNFDPNKISSPPLSEILPAALAQSAFNEFGSHQMAAGIWMQQWNNYDSNISLDRYFLGTNTFFNNYWNFGAYGGVMTIANSIIELAENENQPAYAAIAKILMAKELGILTSSFGDIPYSEAFNPDILNPSYDAQEEIYSNIQQLLDEAIQIFEQSAGETVGGDLIFNGDLNKWLQTAHALKARYYMHLTKKDSEASGKVLAEISQSFNNNSDQPDFHFGPNVESANSLAKFGEERPGTMIIYPGFQAKMNAKSDPRIPMYMEFDGSEWLYYTDQQTLFWSRYDSPQPMISYAELKFLEAEAMLNSGNDNDAVLAMIAAVQANMDYLGVPPAQAATYITAHVHFNGLFAWQKLEKIIDEKYFALYAQGTLEIWVDYRRTGYPRLTAHPGGANYLNPGGQIPRRLIYVSNEYLENTENVEAAAERLGGDLLSKRPWAFQ